MKSLLNNFCVISLIILLTSCSSSQPDGSTEAEALYNDIQSNYKGKRYLLSLEKISSFRSKYPYSYFITDVELLRADIYFEQGNYLEAVDAYLSFRDFHPNYKNLDIIEWRISESFFNQLPDGVDRDISPALSAINSYQDLIRKYPESKHLEKAKSRIIKLEGMLEGKELYIADFYFRTKDYQSASYRYRKILKTSRNDKTIEKCAANLIHSFVKLGSKDQCKSSIEMYRNYLNKSLAKSLESKCSEIIEG